MNTNKFDNTTEKLLSELEMSIRVFDEASRKVHNKYMTQTFAITASLWGNFKQEIVDVIEKKELDESLTLKDKIKVKLVKAGLLIDHIYLNRNEKEVLFFCKERVAGLLDQYKEILASKNIDSNIRNMLRHQMATVEENLLLLKGQYKEYTFA